MRVDLITGFLGAGKTTFLKKYVDYLNRKGESFLIIENEFCAWGVDTKLLRDTHDEIEDLSGYCMCCTGKEKFIAMLKRAGAEGYDRVLVEPSGIYDVDEFFSVMRNPGVAAHGKTGSLIAILDALVPQDTTVESDYLMLTQLLAAGAVVVSKSQLYPEETGREALSFVGRHLAPYLTQEQNPMIVCRDWDTFTDDDFRAFDECGYHEVRHDRKQLDHASLYGTYMDMVLCEEEGQLRGMIESLFSDPACGHVLRIKGYAKAGDGTWLEVNCTREIRQVRPAQIRRGLLIVIGQDLDEEKLKEKMH